MGEPTERAAATGPDAGEYLTELLAICTEVLRRPTTADENFFEVGGDSVAATDLFLRLEARLGVELDVGAFFEARDFRDLADRLAGGTAPPAAPAAVDPPNGTQRPAAADPGSSFPVGAAG